MNYELDIRNQDVEVANNKFRVKLLVLFANSYSFTVKLTRPKAFSFLTLPNKQLKVKEGDTIYMEIGKA